MNTFFDEKGRISAIGSDGFTVPFLADRQGFFVMTEAGVQEITLSLDGGEYCGS